MVNRFFNISPLWGVCLKGQVGAIVIWLSLIVIIFAVVLGYTTMSRVMTSGIVEDIEAIDDVSASADATAVINNTKNVWIYFLFFTLLALVLWGIFASGGGR